MSVWRHLTHPDGMTVSLLVKATGMSKEQVRAELAALEQDGKAWRERAPIGKEHLWWRDSHRPLPDDDILLALGLAVGQSKSPKALRATLQHYSTRTQNPALRQILALSATSKNPRRVIAVALAEHG